jgi:hypothetical protein
VSLNAQLYILPEKLEALVEASLADWRQNNKQPVQGERCRRALLVHVGKNLKGFGQAHQRQEKSSGDAKLLSNILN